VLDQQSGDREEDVPGEISHLDGPSDYLSCLVYDADSNSDLSAYGRGAPSWRGKASQDGKRIQRVDSARTLRLEIATGGEKAETGERRTAGGAQRLRERRQYNGEQGNLHAQRRVSWVLRPPEWWFDRGETTGTV
jgi:hypothetical protein